jgi:hypothetical protein
MHYVGFVVMRLIYNFTFISERDFIGFDEKGNRVLFMTSEADLTDMDDDKIKFRKSLFKK